MNITDVEWIGPAQAERLNAVDVVRDEDLLARGATRAGRHALAAATGIPEQALLGWIRRLELLRIDGVGPEHVNLLTAAGVDGASELARRDPRRLAETLAELGRTRASAREAPDVALVADWIRAAPGAKVVED